MGGRVASIVVMVAVSVVLRVHWGRCAVAVAMTVTGRRGHRRTESVVVVAVAAGAGIDANPWRCAYDYPAFGARTIPVEGEWLKVLERGEGVKLVIQLVVWHDGERIASIDAAGWDVDGNPLDAARTYSDVLVGVVVAVVRVKVEINVTPIGVVADVLHVVIDRDRVVVVHHHGL